LKVIYAIVNGYPQRLDLIEDGSAEVTELNAPKEFCKELLESYCQVTELSVTSTTRLISEEEYFSLISKCNIKQ
jgi:hypothetical protein